MLQVVDRSDIHAPAFRNVIQFHRGLAGVGIDCSECCHECYSRREEKPYNGWKSVAVMLRSENPKSTILVVQMH